MKRMHPTLTTALALAVLALTLGAAGAVGQESEWITELRQWAEQGDPEAQLRLGGLYEYGARVPEDDAEAVKWYRRAAEQGEALAQLNLGLMYALGEGVPEDDAEAVKWYRKAAEQGNAMAQTNLGFMYGKGEGVLEDYVRAYAWYNLAAAQGNETARENKDKLRPRMTAEQVAEAQKLSAELFERIEQAE